MTETVFVASPWDAVLMVVAEVEIHENATAEVRATLNLGLEGDAGPTPTLDRSVRETDPVEGVLHLRLARRRAKPDME